MNNKNVYNSISFKNTLKKEFTSVIIPVYKDVSGLRDTLESLFRQTISKSRFEIIVANDGADQEISKVCKKFKVKEIRIFPNKGSYNARNKAIEQSRGEFLAFTDADVILPKDWIKNGLSLLKQYDYVGGPVEFGKKTNLTPEEKYASLYEFNVKEAFKWEHFFVTANMFTKRKIIEDIGGFDSRLYSGGDTEFGNRIYSFTKYKSHYSTMLTVIHPFRNYNEIIIKKRRTTLGKNDLISYYPNRFNHLRSSLIDEILKILTPPTKHISDIGFFTLFWNIKFRESIYKIRYIKSMRLAQDNSKIDKLLKIMRL